MWSWGARWDSIGVTGVKEIILLQVAGRKVGFRGFAGLAEDAKEIIKDALNS